MLRQQLNETKYNDVPDTLNVMEGMQKNCILIFYCKFCYRTFFNVLRLKYHAEVKHAGKIRIYSPLVTQNCKKIFCLNCKIIFSPRGYCNHDKYFYHRKWS